MNYLKTSLIGIGTSAALLAGTALLANAQVVGNSVTSYGSANGPVITTSSDSSAITAVGNSNSAVYYLSNVSLSPSQLAVANAIPANYRTGYYNYPSYVASTSALTTGMWVNGVWVYSTNPVISTAYNYPGVPNTGGPITVTTTSTGYTTANPATGTYIAPMISYNGMGITGGVSIPVGYTPAIGMNGAILTTGNWNTSGYSGITYPGSTYPGVPNTGGPITNVNGYLNSNGLIHASGIVRVNGIVTIVTPTAIGLNNGGQTWTIGWNSGTTFSTANSSVNMTGGQISVGDTIEVDGVIDSTYSSKINATAIRDLSFH